MASLSEKERYTAATLYESGLSARQVASALNVSIDAVFYALRRLNVPRRTIRESNRLRFERKLPSYTLKISLSPREEKLRLAAVMLYWAEGYKVGRGTIDFANSDPSMVLLFITFLRSVCGVNEQKIRCFIYAFDTQNIEELQKFWMEVLNITEQQFTKPQIRATKPSKYGHRMPYGLVHVRYCDTKLLKQILAWIDEYQQKCVGGGVVNRRGL